MSAIDIELILKAVLIIFVFGYRWVYPEKTEAHLYFVGAWVLCIVTTNWFAGIVNSIL